MKLWEFLILYIMKLLSHITHMWEAMVLHTQMKAIGTAVSLPLIWAFLVFGAYMGIKTTKYGTKLDKEGDSTGEVFEVCGVILSILSTGILFAAVIFSQLNQVIADIFTPEGALLKQLLGME